MKYLRRLIILCICFIPSISYADNIYNIDIDIYIDENGTANITELWNVKADSGSEWYKSLYNLGNSQLQDYKVSMDGERLTYKNWDINENIYEKKGYYGINTTDKGIELCFGKSDYKNHIFTISYQLTNYIFNTEDSQVLYWTLLPKISINSFNATVTSYYDFPITLDVWGYGYTGYAYVNGGKISMSNENKLKNDRVVLLTRFPKGTFNTTNSYSEYKTFYDVYKQAQKGTLFGKLGKKTGWLYKYYKALIFIFLCILLITIARYYQRPRYSYKQKRIIKKEVLPYREVPCNKDIYIANSILKLNNKFNNVFDGYNDTNIFGAIILKWIKNDMIQINNITKGKFNKETSTLDLTLSCKFDNKYEEKLFGYMKKASTDGILEPFELQRWCLYNSEKLVNLLEDIGNDYIKTLKKEGKIYHRKSKKEGKAINIIDDFIFEESLKLCGLNKFLEEFSKINEREAIEVKIWEEYLMFAYLFGIADKVLLQLKKLYPQVIEAFDYNIDYNTFSFINTLSRMNRVSSLNLNNYSNFNDENESGGGGFSSGGGGFGSFGGGGSAGGR